MANNEMNVLKVGNSEFEIADAAARQDVSDLKDETNALKNALFEERDVVINPISQFLTFKDGYYAGPSGWNASSSYKSYYFVSESEFTCYMEDASMYYFSIALYNGEVSQSNFIAMYRKNGSSENTLPTENNKLTVPQGYVFVISTTTGVPSFDIYTSLKEYKVSDASRIKVRKDANKITITQKSVTYEFMRDTNSSINLDTWRIRNYNVGSLRYENMEIEGVIKQQDTSDFIGGYHGDEHYTDLKIYVDGESIAESATFEERYAERVTVLVTSDVYYCDTEIKAFTRYVQMDFFDNKLIITNRWDYVGNTPFIVQRYPCGMFSLNVSDIDGYTTNYTPFIANSVSSPSNQIIDKVEFIGDGFTVSVKYLSEKDKTYYRGTVTYFSSENPPRVKAYLMGVYEYQSTRTLNNGDIILSQVEISNW